MKIVKITGNLLNADTADTCLACRVVLQYPGNLRQETILLMRISEDQQIISGKNIGLSDYQNYVSLNGLSDFLIPRYPAYRYPDTLISAFRKH